MNTTKKIARIVGGLFIVATVTAILGYEVILAPILAAPNLLANVSAQSTQVTLGVLLVSINAIAIASIGIMLFPIFKQHSETLALGYVVARVIEPVILLVGAISLLSLVAISREASQVGAADMATLQTVATSFVAVHELTYLFGGAIALSLTALILNTILYQSRLVPRWIAVWGLLAALLMIASGSAEIFGVHIPTTISALFMLPIALQEMVFAGWLVIKGFNPEGIESLTTDSGAGQIDLNGEMSPTPA